MPPPVPFPGARRQPPVVPVLHSPGPFTASPFHELVYDAEGTLIGMAISTSLEVQGKDHLATGNASLFVHSPVMLTHLRAVTEALAAALVHLDEVVSPLLGPLPRNDDRWNALSAALAFLQASGLDTARAHETPDAQVNE